MELHKVRAGILYTLRHTQATRFSELMKHSNLESDSFKFHVKALVDQGHVHKLPNGAYTLTAAGKERANNLDEAGQHNLRQPKLSVLMVLSHKRADGQLEYLVQQRLRQPFYGYIGFLSGPAQWGMDFEATAQHEIAKQCGITTAAFQVHSFYRQQDYEDTNSLLEDKLFVIVTASVTDKEVFVWQYGKNMWMTESELAAQAKVFESSAKVLAILTTHPTPQPSLHTGSVTYSQDQY